MYIDKQIEELPLTLTVGDISRILNIGKNNAWMLNPKKQNGA